MLSERHCYTWVQIVLGLDWHQTPVRLARLLQCVDMLGAAMMVQLEQVHSGGCHV